MLSSDLAIDKTIFAEMKHGKKVVVLGTRFVGLSTARDRILSKKETGELGFDASLLVDVQIASSVPSSLHNVINSLWFANTQSKCILFLNDYWRAIAQNPPDWFKNDYPQQCAELTHFLGKKDTEGMIDFEVERKDAVGIIHSFFEQRHSVSEDKLRNFPENEVLNLAKFEKTYVPRIIRETLEDWEEKNKPIIEKLRERLKKDEEEIKRSFDDLGTALKFRLTSTAGVVSILGIASSSVSLAGSSGSAIQQILSAIGMGATASSIPFDLPITLGFFVASVIGFVAARKQNIPADQRRQFEGFNESFINAQNFWHRGPTETYKKLVCYELDKKYRLPLGTAEKSLNDHYLTREERNAEWRKFREDIVARAEKLSNNQVSQVLDLLRPFAEELANLKARLRHDEVVSTGLEPLSSYADLASYFDVDSRQELALREREVDTLSKTLKSILTNAESKERGKRVLLISGEPGVGKSWLTWRVMKNTIGIDDHGKLKCCVYPFTRHISFPSIRAGYLKVNPEERSGSDVPLVVLDDNQLTEYDASRESLTATDVSEIFTDLKDEDPIVFVCSMAVQNWHKVEYAIPRTRVEVLVELCYVEPLQFEDSKKLVLSFYDQIARRPDAQPPPYPSLKPHMNDELVEAIVRTANGNAIVIRLFFETTVRKRYAMEHYELTKQEIEDGMIEDARFYALHLLVEYYLKEDVLSFKPENAISTIDSLALVKLAAISAVGLPCGFLTVVASDFLRTRIEARNPSIKLPRMSISLDKAVRENPGLPLFRTDRFGMLSPSHDVIRRIIEDLTNDPARTLENLGEQFSTAKLRDLAKYKETHELLRRSMIEENVNALQSTFDTLESHYLNHLHSALEALVDECAENVLKSRKSPIRYVVGALSLAICIQFLTADQVKHRIRHDPSFPLFTLLRWTGDVTRPSIEDKVQRELFGLFEQQMAHLLRQFLVFDDSFSLKEWPTWPLEMGRLLVSANLSARDLVWRTVEIIILAFSHGFDEASRCAELVMNLVEYPERTVRLSAWSNVPAMHTLSMVYELDPISYGGDYDHLLDIDNQIRLHLRGLIDLLDEHDPNVSLEVLHLIIQLLATRIVAVADLSADVRRSYLTLLRCSAEATTLNAWERASTLVDLEVFSLKEIREETESLLRLLGSQTPDILLHAWMRVASLVEKGIILPVECRERIDGLETLLASPSEHTRGMTWFFCLQSLIDCRVVEETDFSRRGLLADTIPTLIDLLQDKNESSMNYAWERVVSFLVAKIIDASWIPKIRAVRGPYLAYLKRNYNWRPIQSEGLHQVGVFDDADMDYLRSGRESTRPG